MAVAFAAAGLSVFVQFFTENLVTGVFPLWYLSIGVAFFTAEQVRERSPRADRPVQDLQPLAGA